jgi:hypothetical protein
MRRTILLTLAALLSLTTVTRLAQPSGNAVAQELKTLKERLSDKASDPQRVDNCHVPPERRGPEPRPDCPAGPEPSKPADEGGPASLPESR